MLGALLSRAGTSLLFQLLSPEAAQSVTTACDAAVFVPPESTKVQSLRTIIHGRDDEHIPVTRRETTDDWTEQAIALDIKDLAAMSMGERYAWVRWFMGHTGVVKFTNFLGILKFFEEDPDFRDRAAWASYADAGVLQAFQDGYRLYQGLPPIGWRNGPVQGSPLHAGAGWHRFFEIQTRHPNSRAAERAWGTAEQAGVNYGCTVARDKFRAADPLQQQKIYRLLLWSNIYRGMKSRGWDRSRLGRYTFAPVMSADNWASEVFVYGIGRSVITHGHEWYHRNRMLPYRVLARRLMRVELGLMEGLHERIAFDASAVHAYRAVLGSEIS